MQFFANFETKLLLIFSRVLTTKYFILHRFKIDLQKAFFYTPHPWGKSTKVFFQKWQKTAYQTSSNRSILMVFYRFNDVWYAVFCQFWKTNFVYFPQVYWQQNILFYIDLKSTPKKFFLYATPLRKINKSFLPKMAKNYIPNLIKSINFDGFWSI